MKIDSSAWFPRAVVCVLALRSSQLSDQRGTWNQIPAKTSAIKGETPFLAYFRDRANDNWGRGGVRKGNG